MMTRSLFRLAFYFVYLLLFWGCFRFFVRLPDLVTELWFKPLIWLTPLFWWQLSMKRKLSLFEGDILPSVGYGLIGGLSYFVLLGSLVGIRLSLGLDQVGIAGVTAVVEELVFSGVILSILIRETKREGLSLALMALMFALIHLPINVFVRGLPIVPLFGAFLLAFFVSLINGFLRLRANNVLAAIVAHFVFLAMALS